MNTTPVPGDRVITFYDSEPIIYGGPSDYPGSTELSLNMRDRFATRYCDVNTVAPADITVPASDPRAVVVKAARKPYAWAPGPWSLALPGRDVLTWHRVKRDAVEQGARRMAILDHVAGRVASV